MTMTDEQREAFRKMDALAATGEDTPEYRAAFAEWAATHRVRADTDKAELARIIRTANDAHLPGDDRWDEGLARAIIAAGWLPPTEWQYAHKHWGWKTTDNMVKVTEAKFIEHAPSGHLSSGAPYWNYIQFRRRKAGPWEAINDA